MATQIISAVQAAQIQKMCHSARLEIARKRISNIIDSNARNALSGFEWDYQGVGEEVGLSVLEELRDAGYSVTKKDRPTVVYISWAGVLPSDGDEE